MFHFHSQPHYENEILILYSQFVWDPHNLFPFLNSILSNKYNFDSHCLFEEVNTPKELGFPPNRHETWFSV